MTKDERIEYDEITNYVETSQPDTIAKYIRKLLKENERIAELEREVAELHTTLNQLLLGDLAFLKPQRDDGKSMKKRVLLDLEKEIRQEICEKIRNYIHSKECQINGMNFIWLLHELDQIERGEE